MNEKKKHILVVDDEQDICQILQFNLLAAGYEVDTAQSAEEALGKIASGNCYALLLLDVMMPGMNGFEMAQHLKKESQTSLLPIIFLTALGSEEDVVAGLHIGADDYISKPFSVREVVARVEAVLRRIPYTEQSVIAFEGIRIDISSKTATVDGDIANLTPTELELLSFLLRHRRKVFTRQQLLMEVWPDNVVVTERTVDVNIARLRKKIGVYAHHITARQRYGYCFE